MTEAESHSYFLGYQILASLILAILCILLGILIAWIVWGHIKFELDRTLSRNRELRAKLNSIESNT